MPTQLKDDRAIFCSYGMETTDHKNFKLTGPMKQQDNANFYDCWAGLKFTGVYSTADLPKLHERQSGGWPDTDIPMMRLAEAYLIRGEAKARRTGNWGDALSDVNELRARANADPLAKISSDGIEVLDEWCREFWFEGRRRMDLIRFGRFFGKEADQNRYHWEGRMGRQDGQGASYVQTADKEYMNWFPVPSEDKRSNPNFKTDVEGDPMNDFRGQGGDGYTY